MNTTQEILDILEANGIDVEKYVIIDKTQKGLGIREILNEFGIDASQYVIFKKNKRRTPKPKPIDFLPDNLIQEVISKINPYDDVEIYTDGSCLKNNGKNKSTHALVVVANGENVFEHSASEKPSTNNRAELMAIVKATQIAISLNGILKNKATIFADSKYAIQTLFTWSKKWLIRGKKKKNMDIVNLFHRLNAPLRFSNNIKWVRGHSGNKWNEYVDGLCKGAYKVN